MPPAAVWNSHRWSKLMLMFNYSGNVGRSNNASIFVGGFILGGIVVGALGCIYAPKVIFSLHFFSMAFGQS